MRIHLQSKPSSTNFALTPANWDAAARSAPDVAEGHDLSFGEEADAFAAGMADAEVLVCHTAALADGLPPSPSLKLIFVTSAGLDKLAPFDWLPDGVALMNNRGTHAAKAGEYGLMALLMLVNRIPAQVTAQRDGAWRMTHGSVLRGHRVTIVGLGSLGGSTAAHAHAFGMHVTGVRTAATPHPACHQVIATDGLDAVLPETEILFLATPLTPATKGLLSRERIAMLPPGAGVVNIGRGGLVEQDAVLDALDRGHLGGAVLDVWDPEPLPPGHRAWTTRNLIVTPHNSADDPGTYNVRSLEIMLENLRAHRDGTPLPNRFDIARGY